MSAVPPPSEPGPSWRDSTVREASCPEGWTGLITNSFVPLTARPLGTGPLHGRLRTIQRGSIGLARIDGTAQRVRRGRPELARSSSEMVYLNVQLSGVGQVRNRLGETTTVVGGGVIVPSHEPFELRFEQPFSQLCVSMPAGWLADRITVPPAALMARQADLTRGIGRLVRASLDTMVEAGEPDEVELCADLFVRALIGAVRQPASGSAGQLGRVPLLHGIGQLIARRLGDPAFTPAAAARELGCSLSTLHLHCQRSGRSFGTMLAEARLSAAAEALRLGPLNHGRVEFVAFACGFTNPSHFSRKFSARFGVPPGRYR